MQNIGVFLAGLAEPGSLGIGEDLIHMLQLPLQLVNFCFAMVSSNAATSTVVYVLFSSAAAIFCASKSIFILGLLYHKPMIKYIKSSVLRCFCQNKSFSFPLRIAVFCSIRSPSTSQRKLCESSSLSSASDLGH